MNDKEPTEAAIHNLQAGRPTDYRLRGPRKAKPAEGATQ